MYIQRGANHDRNQVRKVGSSSVMTLRSEVLTILDAKPWGTVFVARGDDGCLKIIANDPKVAQALNAAELIMDENRDLLNGLA